MPGNSVRQQALRELLNSGADVDLQGGDFHPNDVASLLKSFLGELPEPLLTHRHFTAHLKIAGESKPPPVRPALLLPARTVRVNGPFVMSQGGANASLRVPDPSPCQQRPLVFSIQM